MEQVFNQLYSPLLYKQWRFKILSNMSDEALFSLIFLQKAPLCIFDKVLNVTLTRNCFKISSLILREFMRIN